MKNKRMKLTSDLLRLLPCLLCLPWFAHAAADRVLFDFESGTYAGWTYEGAHAFEDKPFDTKEALEWREDRRPAGWQGKYMVTLGDTRHGKSDDGRLVSDEFTIDRPYLKFLYAGEVNPRVLVALRVDGKQVRVAYGNNAYHLRVRGWDVREFAGKKARLVIEEGTPVDALIRLDYFHLSDTPPPSIETFAEERPQESSVLRYGEFRPILEWTNKSIIHHTGLLKGHDGRWHLYGSTGTNAWDYSSDRAFHATAPAINGPYAMESAPLITADPAAGEKWIREPFVLLHDGTYYCWFLGNGTPWTGWDPTYRWKEGYFAKTSQGPYSLHLATSKDLKTWTRPKPVALFTEMPWCFNPYVVRVGDEWVMYYAGTVNSEVLGQHCLIARTSKDLVNWGERRVVLKSESEKAWPEHAFLHSPVVWQDHGAWWLLAGPVGNMNLSRFHHRGLWRSDDPFAWQTAVKERTPYNGLFLEGGAKVLRDENGKQWITHSGPWAGGVWIAPLHWNTAALSSKPEKTIK